MSVVRLVLAFLLIASLFALALLNAAALLSSTFAVAAERRRSIENDNEMATTKRIEELFEFISEDRLNAIADRYRQEYESALPFPHIAIDGLFPENFLKAVELETREDKYYNFSTSSSNLNNEKEAKCVKGFSACHVAKKFQHFKSSIAMEGNMGLHTRILFGALKSSNFIQFLERLTQIEGILPDPHYRGSGLHFIASGGFLDIHADFNKYERFNLDRRVNAFVFLNPDWKEEYGGHLELWNRNMTQCSKRVLPTLGRFFVFSTTDFSYHGHPNALTTPPNRARRSAALYYYSNGRPKEECLHGDCSGKGHSTLFQQPRGCSRCEEQTCRAYNDHETIPWAIKE